MRGYPLIFILVFFYILKALFLSRTCTAQSLEEMEILRMFYKDKDLVVSPTRHPKHISQVAENITIITASDIEAMNAHTVAEVLNSIPGLFINFNQDFGAPSLIYAQGSEDRHVLVLLDGIRWNFLNSGAAETNSIPTAIIERIEVIKGPASSTWGSSLGGVINIITKSVGTSQRLEGSVSASFAEKNTRDYRADLSGRAGIVGYYLFAGKQDSDGLRSSRYFESNSLYSKLIISPLEDMDLGLSIGYSDPDIGVGDFQSVDMRTIGKNRNFYSIGDLNTALTNGISLNLTLHHFRQKAALTNKALGLGYIGPLGELFLENIYDEETTGASAQITLTRGPHTAVFGMDLDRGKLEQTTNAGPLLQLMGVPANSLATPRIDRWALFVNDSIVMGRWSVTPGIRYDHNSVTGSFVSPSLGLTYRIGKDTIIRTSASRGFTIPPLSWTSGGALFLDSNPSLDPEEVLSFQAGIESASLKYIWLKAGLFRHNLNNALTRDRGAAGPPTFNALYVNGGEIRRQGIEAEVETISFYNLSVLSGFAYVDLDPQNESGSDEIYSLKIAIKYDNKRSFRAHVSGHYLWWDLADFTGAYYKDFIWDLNINKKVWSKENTEADIFFTCRNLFNGSQFLIGDNRNPGRWLEAGVRFRF